MHATTSSLRSGSNGLGSPSESETHCSRGTSAPAQKQRFFIVGCPRSGTTLLQVILNRHPSIVIPPETKLFYYYHRMPTWMRERAVRRINEDLGIQLPDWAISTRTSTPTAFDLMMKLYAASVGKQQATWCGEKSPEHTTRFAWILSTFPDARYIAITRDGRDVVASLMKAPWIKCNHLSAAMIWRRYQRAVLSLKNVAGSRVLLVKYEDLVDSPERVVRQVLGHLRLPTEPYAEKMIQVQPETDTRSFPDRELSWKATSLQPISRNVSSKASKHLTRTEVQEVELLTRKELMDFGYSMQECFKDQRTTMLRTAVHVSETLRSLGPQCLLSEAIATWKSLLRG